MKGLIAYIYKAEGRDASNGGISSHFDKVLVVGDGIDGIFEANGLPVVTLEKGNLPNTCVARPQGRGRGMFGGCYVSTSDSRFSDAVEKLCGQRFYGAVALHDRFE